MKDDELKSEINFTQPDEKSYDGEKLSRYVADEVGQMKTNHGNKMPPWNKKPLILVRLNEDKMNELGWCPKYKSCHTQWTKDGMALHQSEDVDENGQPIKDYDFYLQDFTELKPIRYLHELELFIKK